MKNRAGLMYVGIGLVGLVLLAVAYAQRRETLSPVGMVVYVVSALVLVVWAAMGVSTAKRRAQEAALRQQREEEERLRREAEAAARRAVDAVNARRTTSLGGTTITVHRRGASDQTRER